MPLHKPPGFDSLVAIENDDLFVDEFQAEFMRMPQTSRLIAIMRERVNKIADPYTYIEAMQILEGRFKR